MKLKSITTLVLLFVISFSIVHEYVFAFYDPEPCSTTEYVSEFEGPTDCGDICDIRYKYHHAYLLPANNILLQVGSSNFLPILKNNSYIFKTNLEFFKPPIV